MEFSGEGKGRDVEGFKECQYQLLGFERKHEVVIGSGRGKDQETYSS